jgi:hypothetical protein
MPLRPVPISFPDASELEFRTPLRWLVVAIVLGISLVLSVFAFGPAIVARIGAAPLIGGVASIFAGGLVLVAVRDRLKRSQGGTRLLAGIVGDFYLCIAFATILYLEMMNSAGENVAAEPLQALLRSFSADGWVLKGLEASGLAVQGWLWPAHWFSDPVPMAAGFLAGALMAMQRFTPRVWERLVGDGEARGGGVAASEEMP